MYKRWQHLFLPLVWVVFHFLFLPSFFFFLLGFLPATKWEIKEQTQATGAQSFVVNCDQPDSLLKGSTTSLVQQARAEQPYHQELSP